MCLMLLEFKKGMLLHKCWIAPGLPQLAVLNFIFAFNLNMKEVYIIDAVRTAIGKYGGALSAIRPDDLLAHVIKFLLQKISLWI